MVRVRIPARAIAIVGCFIFVVLLMRKTFGSFDIVAHSFDDPPVSPQDYNPARLTYTAKSLHLYEPKNWTTALIMGARNEDDTTWTDMIPTSTGLKIIIYNVDDRDAEYHVPSNNGHEAMVYLTYIIDHYTSPSLPDLCLFMHSGRDQWHNPRLLNFDALELLARLNLNKVARDGYVNFRCTGKECPAHIDTTKTEPDPFKTEERLVGPAWRELFPTKPVPDILSQACCSQFGVTRERILARPLAMYKHMRDWLMETEIQDWQSGRVMEYVWQYVFANVNIFCPEPMVCYCELYGACFESEEEYQEWVDMEQRRGTLEEAMREQEYENQAHVDGSHSNKQNVRELERLKVDMEAVRVKVFDRGEEVRKAALKQLGG